jgi:hypothetical protein
MHDDASLETEGRLVLHELPPAGPEDVSFSCPKCASRSGSMLEEAYRTGSSKRASPPEKREVKGWLFLGLGAALALVALQPGSAWIGDSFAAIAIAAAVVGSLASLFNLRRLPSLLDDWRKSVMCSRCGHVFRIDT